MCDIDVMYSFYNTQCYTVPLVADYACFNQHTAPRMKLIMMTSWNGNIFCFTGTLWGEFTGHRGILVTKTRDAEFWCFLWYAPNRRLSKPSRRPWFETPPRSLWRHSNAKTCRYFPDCFPVYKWWTLCSVALQLWRQYRIMWWLAVEKATINWSNDD